MANPTASQCEELWPQGVIPPIRQTLRLLYAHVTSPNYIHDANPWSDSDPTLQTISTASLEILQDHADFHMQAFLYVHELLEKELLNRKLVALTRLDTVRSRETPHKGSRISEVLFDVEDLEPLSTFLASRDKGGDVHGFIVGERIDTMAKMAYAWVDSDRSAARRRTGSESRPSRSQTPRKAAVEARNEAGEDGGLQQEDQCVADVMELEAEMDEFDLVDDGESFSDMESTISSVDSSSPLLGGVRLGEAEVDEVSVDRTNEVVGSATMANTEAGTRKGWLHWFAQ